MAHNHFSNIKIQFLFPRNPTFAAQEIVIMEAKYIQKIAEVLGLSIKQVTNVYNLHSEGSTIPFMARYRKEATGNLDEVVIGNIVEQVGYFNDLQKRKEMAKAQKDIYYCKTMETKFFSRISKSENCNISVLLGIK